MRIFDLHIIKKDKKIHNVINQPTNRMRIREKERKKTKFMKDEIHHQSTIAQEGARVSR